jgi:hypothetical protein
LTTFGVALPTADTNIIGRTYAWNSTFQYHRLRKVWPEVELNSSFFRGRQERRQQRRQEQTFVAPGLVLGRFHRGGRVGFTMGGGFRDRRNALPHQQSQRNSVDTIRVLSAFESLRES